VSHDGGDEFMFEDEAGASAPTKNATGDDGHGDDERFMQSICELKFNVASDTDSALPKALPLILVLLGVKEHHHGIMLTSPRFSRAYMGFIRCLARSYHTL
jgi:hypothetical protein